MSIICNHLCESSSLCTIDCKKLAPEWSRAATELKGKVKLGVVDATVHTQLAQRYGVQGFPTIKFFPGGRKDGQAEEYDGGRTADVSHQFFIEEQQLGVPYFLGYRCMGTG